MIRNFLTTIWRQMVKNKLFSFINISGLALGMSACLVIAQYVYFHSSFDSFHSKGDRIFRIESTIYKEGEKIGDGIKTPQPLAEQIVQSSPHVTQAMRAWPFTYANSTLVYEGSQRTENLEANSIYFGDKSGFKIFDFPFLAGSAARFDEKFKAILPWDMAQKLFEKPQDAIGQEFTLSTNNGKNEFEIVGILEPLPLNSHIQFELLISHPTMENYTEAYKNWDYTSSVMTYLLLDDVENTELVLAQTIDLFEQNTNLPGYSFDWTLTPLSDIHLTSLSGADFTEGVDERTIAALSIVAIIILIIAWINYMNLSLVRTVERLKEMGVRMSMGSSRQQITVLFLLEAFIMNLLAFGIAIGLVQVSQGLVSELTSLPSGATSDLRIVFAMAGMILIGTLFIGFYPKILLKSLKTVNILTGQRQVRTGAPLRKVLVFIQFIVTTFLLAGTITVYKQISYMKNADLKIDVDNILVLESPPVDISSEDREYVAKFRKLITALEAYPEIAAITSGGEVPGESISWRANIRKKNADEGTGIETHLISMDTDYPEFFGLEVVAGRGLTRGDDPWTKGDVVINEKMAEMLGFENPQDAVGIDLTGFYAPLTVRGVLENHHHTSLHTGYQPIAFIISGWVEYYFVKIEVPAEVADKRTVLAQSVTNIKEEWDQIFNDYPMDYFFLDSYFNEQYKADERFGKLFTGFSVLAIVIACLGLFGLTAFTVQQRTKEIGIRKVLGASFADLLQLLSSQYLVLIGLASLLTLPAAYLVMRQWLENYTFRIELDFWFAVIPVFLILLFAFISIISRVAKAAKRNPVEALRYE